MPNVRKKRKDGKKYFEAYKLQNSWKISTLISLFIHGLGNQEAMENDHELRVLSAINWLDCNFIILVFAIQSLLSFISEKATTKFEWWDRQYNINRCFKLKKWDNLYFHLSTVLVEILSWWRMGERESINTLSRNQTTKTSTSGHLV